MADSGPKERREGEGDGPTKTEEEAGHNRSGETETEIEKLFVRDREIPVTVVRIRSAYVQVAMGLTLHRVGWLVGRSEGCVEPQLVEPIDR
jgi:hypothetical protein